MRDTLIRSQGDLETTRTGWCFYLFSLLPRRLGRPSGSKSGVVAGVRDTGPRKTRAKPPCLKPCRVSNSLSSERMMVRTGSSPTVRTAFDDQLMVICP